MANETGLQSRKEVWTECVGSEVSVQCWLSLENGWDILGREHREKLKEKVCRQLSGEKELWEGG